MLALIFYVLAAVSFGLATVGVKLSRVDAIALGLLFFALGHIA